LKEFKLEAELISSHKKNGWFKYGNAGGCGNIKNFIEEEKNAFNSLPKANHVYLRCFVLVDSDKKFLLDKNGERHDLISYLRDNNIDYHVLEKREMENYMHEDVLSEIEGNNDYIRVYKSLSSEQKDFFDIEKGFNKKNRKSLSEPVFNLYANLSDDDYKVLRNGLNYKKFKADFPKLFKVVTKVQFQERTKYQSNPKELEDILSHITELL
jgi:hypothetical protein